MIPTLPDIQRGVLQAQFAVTQLAELRLPALDIAEGVKAVRDHCNFCLAHLFSVHSLATPKEQSDGTQGEE